MPRRAPQLAITIPPRNSSLPRPKTSAWCRPTGRPLLRFLPWVAGCTVVLWIFVLRADRQPLHVYSPQPHTPVEGHKPRPFHLPHRTSAQVTISSWSQRADGVRDTFVHAYDNYRRYAGGYDELLPVSGRGNGRCAHGFLVIMTPL